MFPLHALTFACRFIIVHPCFIACDNSVQKSPLLLHDIAAKLHVCFHMCPFVLICKLPLAPALQKFCDIWGPHGWWLVSRSTVDVQLASYINDSNLSVLLNQSSFVYVYVFMYIKLTINLNIQCSNISRVISLSL